MLWGNYELGLYSRDRKETTVMELNDRGKAGNDQYYVVMEVTSAVEFSLHAEGSYWLLSRRCPRWY